MTYDGREFFFEKNQTNSLRRLASQMGRAASKQLFLVGNLVHF